MRPVLTGSAAALLLAVLATGGCGLKGDLYLEDEAGSGPATQQSRDSWKEKLEQEKERRKEDSADAPETGLEEEQPTDTPEQADILLPPQSDSEVR